MELAKHWVVRGIEIDPLLVFAIISVIAVAGLLTLIVIVWLNGRERAKEAALRQSEARMIEMEVAALKGRLQTMAEVAGTSQAELGRAIHERLDRVSQNIGGNLEETTRKTSENLSKLNERLAVIDTAQRNITELSTRVVSLQDILANKQQRGAFGQLRMETIIQDGLPRDAYSFQATLSNGKRPDCVIHLPGSSAGIVVDAKFPLEAFEALRTAHDELLRKEAVRRVRVDIGKHIDDIAAKYALPGETQDTMLMFVPSESFYADLHEHFPDLLQKAHRARIVIVSPNMLMLAVQTMQSIMKDVRMREQAGPHSARGRHADDRCRPFERTRAGFPEAFRPARRRCRENPHLHRQDRQPRPQDRGPRSGRWPGQDADRQWHDGAVAGLTGTLWGCPGLTLIRHSAQSFCDPDMNSVLCRTLVPISRPYAAQTNINDLNIRSDSVR